MQTHLVDLHTGSLLHALLLSRDAVVAHVVALSLEHQTKQMWLDRQWYGRQVLSGAGAGASISQMAD